MGKSPRHVIGLTGLPSSGKGEVTGFLLASARDRGWGAAHLSFSDQIKAEASARGIPKGEFDRDLLSRIAIELRQAEGPGVLAARIARKIASWPEPMPEFFVVEALRHVGEVEALRQAFGKSFALVAVESEPRLIAARLLARRRPDESPEALRSEENAIALIESELKGKLDALGPNVGACMEHADAYMDNNGSLDELRKCVEEFLDALDRAARP